MESSSFKYKWANCLVNTLNITMNKARHLILKLYKKDYLTEEEVNILLDSIDNKNNYYYTQPVCPTKIDWTYGPDEQPRWTITSNNTI